MQEFHLDATAVTTEQFRAFRGRDVKIGALMRDRGFPVPPGA